MGEGRSADVSIQQHRPRPDSQGASYATVTDCLIRMTKKAQRTPPSSIDWKTKQGICSPSSPLWAKRRCSLTWLVPLRLQSKCLQKVCYTDVVHRKTMNTT